MESAGFKGGRFVATNTGIEPRYFLTDHLGSTRVVVNNFGEVLERNDYHAYGKRWTDANSLLSDNRYGYNGKEKQDFVNLPYLDYSSRMADLLLGRWFNLDPLSEKYYSTSPFVFCAGNPIRNVDVDGRKIYFAPGVSQEFKSKFARTVQYMNQRRTSGNLAALQASSNTYYIDEGDAAFNPQTNTISWNPAQILRTTNGKILFPATILAHELKHGRQKNDLSSAEFNKKREHDVDNSYDNELEKEAITTTEQDAARAHGDIKEGEITRENHGGQIIEFKHPIPAGRILEDYRPNILLKLNH